jgi:hypothetical protein
MGFDLRRGAERGQFDASHSCCPRPPKPQWGGSCTDTAVAFNCYNHFSYQTSATNGDWLEYEVPFAALAQPGGSATWDPSQLFAIDSKCRPANRSRCGSTTPAFTLNRS